MKVTSLRQIIPDSLLGIVIYDLNYYSDEGRDRLINVFKKLNLDEFSIYGCFGRTDIFLMEDATPERFNRIINSIAASGILSQIYFKHFDNSGYCCKINIKGQALINLIIDMLQFFYVCSFEFISTDIEWNKYVEYANKMFYQGDQDSKIAFKSLKFDISIFKGIGPDNIYVNFNSNYNLPNLQSD